MHKFADKTELLSHARDLVEQAVNSLWRDVKNCLKNEFEPAPFPAILFCFSTINLLGPWLLEKQTAVILTRKYLFTI
jgi:hypothetical protein